jgi:hypothetical protein
MMTNFRKLWLATQIGGFCERMKNVPSLLALESLKVVGDVWFGKDIVLQVCAKRFTHIFTLHI